MSRPLKKEHYMAKSTTAVENAVLAPVAAAPGHGIAEHPGNSIHLTLQGKGGVGKSLIASILAQYFADRRREIICIDTDPVNRTLFQYKALNVSRLELLRDGRLDPRVFDDLMGRLITEDATFVVDNGASTFIPLWNYILRNKALDSLARKGRKVYAFRGQVFRKIARLYVEPFFPDLFDAFRGQETHLSMPGTCMGVVFQPVALPQQTTLYVVLSLAFIVADVD